MWHTKDDVIKDLAFLNDSEVPRSKELGKILYSNKKVPKTHLEYQDQFLDPRTGEPINTSNNTLIGSNNCQPLGKGRGKILRNFSKSESQLQKQLRLARPLGSSDALIELYFKENKRETKISAVKNTEKDVHQETTENFNSAQTSGSNENKKRIKAVRKSTSQSNALMYSLMEKSNSEDKSRNKNVDDTGNKGNEKRSS